MVYKVDTCLAGLNIQKWLHVCIGGEFSVIAMAEQRWRYTSKHWLCNFKAMCTYCFISNVRHLKKTMRLINLRYISLQKICLCLIHIQSFLLITGIKFSGLQDFFT